MSVDNVNNKDLVNKNRIRIDKVKKSGQSDESASINKIVKSASLAKDSISISHSYYGDEIETARNILQKLHDASIKRLKSIQARISDKSYNKKEVQFTIEEKMASSLHTLKTRPLNSAQESIDSNKSDKF